MASRSIADLAAPLREMCRRHMEFCVTDPVLRDAGVEVILACTFRDEAEQDRLYAQGRTTPGRIVTNARAGDSAHNARGPAGQPAALAYDVALIRHGKAIWGDDPATPQDEMLLWRRVGALGLALGLTWYGLPGSRFREMPHFQVPNWRDLLEPKTENAA